LVPYDDLPESEKEYDRATALETLKVITYFGETHRHTVMLYALMAKASYHLGHELVARQWLSEADAAYRQSDDIQPEGMSNVCSIIGAVGLHQETLTQINCPTSLE